MTIVEVNAVTHPSVDATFLVLIAGVNDKDCSNDGRLVNNFLLSFSLRESFSLFQSYTL